jgi:hypothetical protein
MVLMPTHPLHTIDNDGPLLPGGYLGTRFVIGFGIWSRGLLSIPSIPAWWTKTSENLWQASRQFLLHAQLLKLSKFWKKLNMKPINIVLTIITCSSLGACDRLGSTNTSVKNMEAKQAETDFRIKALETKVEEISSKSGKWILWRSITSLDQFQVAIPYFANDAYPDKISCGSGAEGYLANEQGKRIAGSMAVQITSPQGYRTVIGYWCLPDTVDPRKTH